MTDPARMLEAAHEAVRLAAHVCRDVQRRLDDVRAITKDDDSPVTVADFASQAVVAHVLRERLGEIPLVAEETSAFLRDPDHRTQLGAALEAARISWPEATEQSLLDAIDLGDAEPDPEGGFWTLDPIDGTKGFLRGQQYAVALGFVRGREPVLAAMACPNLSRNHAASLETPDPVGSVYLAERGSGATEHDALEGAEPPTRLDPGASRSDVGFVVTASVEKKHTSRGDTDRVLELLTEGGAEIAPPARLDSQCKYAVVARGQADAYLRLPRKGGYVERIWDHAAGSLIATESGARAVDLAGEPLDFSLGRGLESNRGIVAVREPWFDRVLDAIGRLRRE